MISYYYRSTIKCRELALECVNVHVCQSPGETTHQLTGVGTQCRGAYCDSATGHIVHHKACSYNNIIVLGLLRNYSLVRVTHKCGMAMAVPALYNYVATGLV